MDTVWIILAIIAGIYLFIGTVYFALDGFVRFPQKDIIERPEHMVFFFLGFMVFVIGFAGEIFRGDISPIPWTAYFDETKKHGAINGFLSLFTVILTDLWLLWIPANIWINHQKKKLEKGKRELRLIDDKDLKLYQKGYLSALYDLNQKRIYTARILNLVIGILLMTPYNPIYSLLENW